MMDILKDILYMILTGFGVVIAKELIAFINKKIDEVQISTEIKKHNKLNEYIDDAQKVIGDVVLTVSQTYVDSLKKAGEFNKEAQEEAKNKAIAIATELISEESKNAINSLYGDFKSYLDVAIESIVNQNKYIDVTIE